MTGKVLELRNVLTEDQLAIRITERWCEWDLLRQIKKNDWEEIRRYVYATDTTQTTNNMLPWKNKTTVPKLCQIRDNLYANYTSTMFPANSSKWLIWEANDKDSNSARKRDSITNYMTWVVSQPWFKLEVDKLILDYIDFGNAFVTVEWLDQRVQTLDKTQVGYVGPILKRISPLDMIMNPTSENFIQSPKIVRSIISMGELRKLLNSLTTDDNRQEYQDLYDYLKNIRFNARTFQGDWIQRDHLYSIDGFTSFRAYLLSDFVEVLTFYGDYYDQVNDIYEENRVITVVDRHKLISNKANPSYFGYPPIFHSPWRKKQENLWGMGPLDNLVGMQYRMDHVENMGSDMWDFTAFPVQKIKGFVEDYTWQPGEKIFVSEEGDVEIVQPDVNIFQSDMKIDRLEKLMEEMAGAPREAMGFRTPGEKTAYEVQSLENASSRLFQSKIRQFEEQILEPAINSMLELARRNMVGATTIRIFDDASKAASFEDLTVEDITGVGRIVPVAARHFSEYTQLVQSLTSLAGSNLWPTVQPHFSGIRMAQVLENIFDLERYGIVMPNIALVEQAEAQQMMNVLEEQVHAAAGTATGIGEDHDLPPQPPVQPPIPPINQTLRRQA